ncbi:hypothetical protein KIH39_00410 [Telmatocola sphagniphila]|uniref:Uncharacterized protein n=1 Tax=Telmatocola sphagniphila TaxID=1123043 RepID=A0A8E6B5B5_9BACT|nr:hypothetical protein [Telmatocola sphagniphila]QVL32415.1 hypothetical protein KIH39_00410 [Telmatocola sphagniphila]
MFPTKTRFRKFEIAPLARLLAKNGPGRVARGLIGFLLGLAVVFSIGELFLQIFPPNDIQIFLGNQASGSGIYKPDRALGADYRSWAEFEKDNSLRLAEYLPLEKLKQGNPVWAFFGNSFIQMQGMLGDTARATVTDKRIFYLGKNETINLRFAQIRLLLENGLQPERIFIELMPLDSVPLGQHPLGDYRVNDRGVITYRSPLPGGLHSTLLGESRLLLAGWMRFAKPIPNANTYGRQLNDRIPVELQEQYAQLFQELAEVTSRRNIPITLLLIPTHEQIVKGAGCAYQDAMTQLGQQFGFDICDFRNSFQDEPDKASLFIPDKHFSPRGNEILLRELLAHLRGRS